MANLFAIHSVGNSLVTYLSKSYEDSGLKNNHDCEFRLLSSGELAELGEIGTTLSLFLHRVTINEHLRNAKRVNYPSDENLPLSLDLHYLMTVWASSALTEQLILAWAMRQLHILPVLDISSLLPDANWLPGDMIQLVPTDLSSEEIMRIWDSLEPSYRLSVAYVARVVRIDGDSVESGRPVVATRFSLSDREAQP